MYVLTSSGVAGFASDWVERKGIEHLCNCQFPAGTECWTFSEAQYEAMGKPFMSAIKPDGPCNFVTIGKTAWKALHPELFDDYTKPQEVQNGGKG